MYEFDLNSVGGFLAAMWNVVGGVLGLDPGVFPAVLAADGGGWLALAILFVAGVSDMFGQSVVLFANRVSPRRFWVSLVMSALVLAFSVVVWAVSIWLVVRYIFSLSAVLTNIFILVALSQAPLLLGFLTLMPYLGNFLYHLVRVWSLLALVVAVKAVASAFFWQGILACLLGWLFVEFIIHMPFLRIKAVDAWLWQVMTGTREKLDTQLAADRLARARGKLLRGHGKSQGGI
ncbi:MAG: hypothetical protein Kow0031_35740 [Anaerolineae bacterium]